jgi:VWFA-related protein
MASQPVNVLYSVRRLLGVTRMKDRVHIVLWGWSVIALAVVLGAQAPTSTQPRFATGATAITVDVVVRDKHGKPVTDLRKEDFELLEDGVHQDIGDMTLVAAGAQGAASTTAVGPNFSSAAKHEASPEKPAPASISAPTFVALVFDRLSPEARALAYNGARSYLATRHDDDFAGLFIADLSLVTIQTYTNNRALIEKALKDAASRATSTFDRAAMTDLHYAYRPGPHQEPEMPIVAAAQDAGRTPGKSGDSPARPDTADLVASVTDRSALMARQMAMNQQGFATTDALHAIIGGLSQLSGRKSVVFFAEGLALPEAVMPQFQSLVAAANRANVSIYTIDSAGLRARSVEEAVRLTVNGVGSASLDLGPDGSSQNSLDAMEGMASALRSDPHTSLTVLARDTGGFLIDNTNDLANGFGRIDLDRRFHYLLTYTPKNADFNGEWRTIAVKVPSRDVEIRARSGYQAVHAPGAIPLLAYEGRAAADLERMPPPAQIPIRAGAFVFPQATGDPRVAILLSTTGRALTFEPTSTGYRTDFTLLARLRDSHGEVVRKASQPYRLTGAAADRDRAQSGDILFYRQPTLPPGSYTLDVAADDAIAKRGGVSRVAVVVPEQTAGPRVSDLIIVGRTERLAPGEMAEDNVLAVGGAQLYPNLGEPLRKRVDQTVSFFAAILPNGTTPSATLALVQNGRTLATLPVTLEAPDATGRIQQVGQIPLASIPPGSYQFVLSVSGGPSTITRAAAFSVID